MIRDEELGPIPPRGEVGALNAALEERLGEVPRETLEPLADRIVIRPIRESERTAAGLYKPEGAIEKPIRGEVLAVGPGKMTEQGFLQPPRVAVGEVVVYGKYSGSEIEIEGETLIVIREADIVARVNHAR